MMSTPGRPRWLIALLLVLAAIQVVGVVRMSTLSADLSAQLSLSLPLEVVAGSLWAVAFLWVAARNSGTIRTALVLLTLFAAYNIGRVALFARADYDRQRLPFLLMILAVWILIAFGTGWMKR